MYDEAYTSSDGDEELPEDRVQKKTPGFTSTNVNAKGINLRNSNGNKLSSRQQEPVYKTVASVAGSSALHNRDSSGSSNSLTSFDMSEESKEADNLSSLQKMAKKEFIQSKETHLSGDNNNAPLEKSFTLAPAVTRRMIPPATSPVNERKISTTPPSFRRVGSASTGKARLGSSEEDQSEDDDDDDDETENDQPTANTNKIEGLFMRDALLESSSSRESLQFDEEDEYYQHCLENDPDVGSMAFNDLRQLMREYGGREYLDIDEEQQDTEDYDICFQELCRNEDDRTPMFMLDDVTLRQRFHEMMLERKRERLRDRYPVLSKYSDMYRDKLGMYNASEYENLKVTADIKELFQYITQYSYQNAPQPKPDVKLKPFLPEFYPSVGDIDGFLKVIHPLIQNDELGIKSLDEPAAFQSDPSVLDLRLRALAKQSSAKAVVIKKVDNVGKNTKIIENWIKDISDLHRSKPSPSVHYSKPMPDIDSLIQEWPPEIEDLLKVASFPSPELDCALADYIDIVCNLLDIPIHKSRIQSLHVLCTLYATLRHFSQYGATGQTDVMPPATSLRYGEVDQLQL